MRTLQLPQGSPQWHQWRTNIIGGSDMGAIMLGDAWPYEDSRIDRVLHAKITRETKTETNFAMRRGTFLEPVARAEWEILHSAKAEPICVQHDDVEWMGVSLDGLAQLRNGSGVILEIKAPKWTDHAGVIAGLVPEHYVPQVQYQLLVTGLDLLHFISITENKLFGASKDNPQVAMVEVRPDPEYQAEILDRGQAFWERVMEGRQRRAA